MRHFDQAKKSGLTDEQIDAIETGRDLSRLGAFEPILRFVDACAASAHVAHETIVNAQTVLSERQIATVIVLVGHYMSVARYVSVLGVELDPQPDGWTTDH